MKHLALLFTIALLTFLPACGGGGGDAVTVITALARTAGCTADGIADYAAIAEAIGDELQKVPVPGVLNVNVVVDGKTVNLTGTITQTGGDLSDGFGVGDGAQVFISSLSVDGVVTGTGDLVFNYSEATKLDLAGTMQLTDGTCTINMNGINLFSDPTADGYPTGAVSFITTVGDDTLEGVILPDGLSADADVNASLNDAPEISFTLDLDTFEVNLR